MRLVDRLEANSMWEPNSGCRIWLGALNREHGVIKVSGKMDYVHRVAWQMERGPIPKGLWVLHNCGLGPCFNIAHLRLGTVLENRRDLNRPGGYRFFPQHGSQVPVSCTPVMDNGCVRQAKRNDAPFDHAELLRMLSYDPATGDFRWRARADRDHTWNARFAGEIAGAVLPIGYRYINFNTKLRTAHRLAWFYMTGGWPTHQIDHVNGQKSDNRWCNLRAATQMQNSANQGLRSTNKSGVRGVSWAASKGMWRAAINVAGQTKFLGYFKSLPEAAAARRTAEAHYHGDFAHIAGNA